MTEGVLFNTQTSVSFVKKNGAESFPFDYAWIIFAHKLLLMQF